MNIEYQKKNDIGLFRLEGSKRYYEARVVWWRFLQAFREDNIKAILAFDNSVNEITPADVLELEEWFSEINFPRNRKVAIVCPNDREDVINRYWDFVGQMKRWSIKVFNNEPAARKWLKSSSKPRKYLEKPLELSQSYKHRVFAEPPSVQSDTVRVPLTNLKSG